MRLIHDLAAIPDDCRGGFLTIGKFDGIHAGHAAILRTLTESAHERRTASIVMTFDPAPAELLHPSRAALPLCTQERKIELIESFQPDLLVVYPTQPSFLQLSAEQFFQTIVLDTFHASGLAEGANFTFGRKRGGNSDRLRELCRETGCLLQIVPSVRISGREVSSSRIRTLLRDGEAASARTMLTRPYRMTGIVAHGEHRGRQLGFPTANLSQVRTIIPKPGVYAACTQIDGKRYRVALNIGGNPTFGVEQMKIEAHLIGYHGDLYSRKIALDFYERIRGVQTFSSGEELIRQMKADRAVIETIPMD